MDPRYMTPDLLAVLALTSDVERRKRVAQRNDSAPKDRFEQLPEDFQQRMTDGGIDYAPRVGAVIISADGTPDEVEARVWQRAKHLFDEAA